MLTSKEHFELLNKDDLKEGIIAYKLAKHEADLAKCSLSSQIRDSVLLKMRFEFI
ncbi:MAG: phosphomethylpyrimidine synthase ThiC [Burkholderia sp.]|nr:phosphomethylpyrimidine synthase ThiC [Burkholderia sp.]